MRRTLGALVFLLAACGDDSPEARAPDYQVLEIVSETAAGGTVSPDLTPLPGPDELAGFTEQFESTAFREEIATAVQEHEPREGYVVGAAVVAIGCDVPPGVSVEADGDGFTVEADEVADPLPECFAPVTSVAVIQVRDS